MGKSLLYNLYSTESIPKIDETVDNSIDLTAALTKMYIYNNRILFSFDQNKKVTQILEINIPDLIPSMYSLKKSFKNSKKSNSFIHGENIFIASTTKQVFHLEVVHIKSKEILKKFDIHEYYDIKFKNGPITQTGGVYTSGKELKTTKQFLRKITKDKFRLTVFKNKETYKLSIGGNSPLPNPTGFGGIPLGGFGGVSVFFNPAMFAYSSTRGTKSVEVDYLLDLYFNHKKGEIPKTKFDKIKAFKQRTKTNLSRAVRSSKITKLHKNMPTKEKVAYDDDKNDFIEIFNCNKQLILGSYDKTSKQYYFYTF